MLLYHKSAFKKQYLGILSMLQTSTNNVKILQRSATLQKSVDVLKLK